MNFYKHFLGDYDRDTKGLSLTEHGAYRRLIDHCYATEEMLPNDIGEVYRIATAMTPAEKKAVDRVAERFFPVNGDGRRHHKRIEEELGKRQQQVEHNRVVGRLGGRPKKPEENPSGIPSGIPNGTRSEPGDNPSHSQSQKEQRQELSPADAGEVRDGVAAVPDCPHEKLIEAYHELLPTCTQVVEWNDTRKSLMRARWREKSMPKGSHAGYQTVEAGLAYWRRFFGYVSQSDFLTGRANPAPGRKPFVASLEWLVRPTNFAKVIEGTYHA